jgi:tripartite-type tricarboxylate transporter receptor subunit TctC
MTRPFLNRIFASAALALLCSAGAWAQTGKAITLVVPYPAGGPLDSSARIVADLARPQLGAIVVENKPGAGGNIGVNQVAKSAVDAQQIVMGAVATHAINPWLYANFPYDASKDFKPLVLVGRIPNVLVMNTETAKKLGIQKTTDLLAYVRKNPGRLNYGSGGNGSIGHIAGEMFKSLTKTSMVHIPYQGAAPAQLGLLSGQVDLMFDNLASALPQIRSGKLVALGLTTLQSNANLPEVPSLNDTVAGFNVSTWFGLFAPAGVPEAVAQKYISAFSAALSSAEGKEKLGKMGIGPETLQGAELGKFAASEYAKYGALIKSAGIKLD